MGHEGWLKARWFAAGVLSAVAAGLLVGARGGPRPGEGPSARVAARAGAVSPARDGKLRVLCFGAHPDDCELKAAGVAARWAAAGHHVKFVSATNGDVGHWRMAGGPLARRRTREVERCAKALGIETEVLDIHDGELLPTLENRKTFTRLIRRWKADVVMGHR